MPRGFKFVNGVMVRDTDTLNPGQVVPLAVVASPDDIATATAASQVNGYAMQVPQATIVALSGFDDEAFTQKFRAGSQNHLDGNAILDKIAEIFAAYEVPIGLLSKLLALSEYKLNFIIDDSGSMGEITDSFIKQAGPYMAGYFQEYLRDPTRNTKRRTIESPMTRWEEAEDRLHVMLDILTYVPTQKITISFLNRSNVINLDRTGMRPDQFADFAHRQIHDAFRSFPNGGTPIFGRLNYALRTATGLTMHYLFTDGEPSDKNILDVQELIMKRPYPRNNPLTLVSCTGDDTQVAWMKDVEEKAPFTAEVDDYGDERDEVLAKQGPVFPFTRGLWLLCLLVGAINPDDLDALDDEHPLTKFTLDNLMGRVLTAQEYNMYWRAHPKGPEHNTLYPRFASEALCAREIVSPQVMPSAPPASSVRGLFNRFM